MSKLLNKSISDCTVIALGIVGLLLGISGLFDPASQYKMLGLQDTGDHTGLTIRGLLRSGSVSAIYVGLLYFLGVWKQWTGFKPFIIFARLLMTSGFMALFLCGQSVEAFKSAAIWEGAGATIIWISLFADRLRRKKQIGGGV